LKTSIKNISGWGNFPVIKATVLQPVSVDEVLQLVKDHTTLIPRGNGRSYGDSSLHTVVVDMKGLNKIINETDNTVEVEAGITIEALLQHIVPQKKFFPVTPGIKSITIGGAIACDVHGKNHLHNGSFFNHTISFKLITEDGNLINCSRIENKEHFLKAFGGMGLSGIIVSAVIAVMPIETTWFKENQAFATSLNEIFTLMEANKNKPYMATWIDMLNKEIKGIIKTGNWVEEQEYLNGKASIVVSLRHNKSVPFRFPFALPAFVFKWYNRNYFNKAKKIQSHIIHYNDFFYPLDSIRNWNHVYGPKGLLQYHFVLPLQSSKEGMQKVIALVKKSKATCTLAVMKLFGKPNDETPESFPMEGYNLALDFIQNKYAIVLFPALDCLVKSLGGKVYKTKDALSTLPEPVLLTSKFKSLQNDRYASKKIT
jgi:decaprenylphospho-beta-D-ribofuranose 2-oxidase